MFKDKVKVIVTALVMVAPCYFNSCLKCNAHIKVKCCS
jgi:hypothetical protein